MTKFSTRFSLWKIIFWLTHLRYALRLYFRKFAKKSWLGFQWGNRPQAKKRCVLFLEHFKRLKSKKFSAPGLKIDQIISLKANWEHVLKLNARSNYVCSRNLRSVVLKKGRFLAPRENLGYACEVWWWSNPTRNFVFKKIWSYDLTWIQ